MRNLLISFVLCGMAGVALADCPAAPIAPTQTRPAAEVISSAAAQAALETAAAQARPVMLPASVHNSATQIMGAPHAPGPAVTEPPRHGSRLAMVLAAVGVMLLIVLRRVGASN
jgi:hypothetical protein